MAEAHGHHYVSQCYLKRFTSNGSKNSRLWVFDLLDRREFMTKPSSVAKQRDFNHIEGRPIGELENSLSAFESKVNDALDTIEKMRSLEDEEAWIHVLNLIAMFAVRNPRNRAQMQKFREQSAKILMDVMVSTPELWEAQKRKATAAGYIDPNTAVTYEEAKDFAKRGEYTIQVPTASHIGTEFHVFEPVLRTMVARKWSLLIAPPESGGFLTSDHPVCLFNSSGEPPSLIYSPGYGMTETTVLFPVTRDLVAIGTFEKGGGVTTINADQMALINGQVMHFARRQVFAASDKANVKLKTEGPTYHGADISRFL